MNIQEMRMQNVHVLVFVHTLNWSFCCQLLIVEWNLSSARSVSFISYNQNNIEWIKQSWILHTIEIRKKALFLPHITVPLQQNTILVIIKP